MPRRSLHAVLIAAALALLVLAAIGLLSRKTTEPKSQATVAPGGIQAVATDVQLVPKQDTPRRLQITAELGRALVRLYNATFATPTPTPAPPPAKTVDKLKGLFTPLTRSSLHTRGDVFTLPTGLEFANGRIGYSGVITIDANSPAAALLHVDFVALARRGSHGDPDVRVHQQGTLSLVRQASHWLVDGFDVRFATKPLPSPTPSG